MERGKSSVFLAGGVSLQELESQRLKTDGIVQILREALKKPVLDEESRRRISQSLDTLSTVREDVSRKKNPPSFFKDYTLQIQNLFSAYETVFSRETTRGIGKILKDLSVLEEAKENAGQTRALTAAILQQNKILSGEEFSRLFSLKNNIESYLRLSAVPFSEETRKKVNASLNSSYWNQIQETFRILAQKFQIGNYGIASKDFFLEISAFIDLLAQAVETENAYVQDYVALLKQETLRDVWISISLSVLLSLIMLAVGISVVRSVKKRIGATLDILKEISQGEGDLSRRLDESSHDEFGQIALYFNRFLDTLSGMIRRVIENNHQILEVTSEVFRGNNDLAKRVDAQAASLEETAASIEEMNANIKNIAGNANSARNHTSSTQESALEGETVLKEAVNAIQNITVQTSKIKEIIKIIDGIAFQTNILALNAAVEAARAKEHGKGFAVVANEVRNLAQKSAENAKQIASMIEEMVKGIEKGNRLAIRSQEKFFGIKEKIEKTTEVIDEVAASSEEQSKGVEQINQAVAQLDEITQNNASLVQQIATSAQELESQSREVVELLKKFKISVKNTQKSSSALRKEEVKDQGPILFSWDDKYSVLVEKMDEHHQKLFALINRLYASLKLGKSKEALSELLKELIDYTRFHFTAEEQLMKSYEYSGLPEQLDQHRKFVDKISSVKKDFDEGRTLTLSADLMNFLKDWLLKHIMVIDKKYSDFFNERGIR